MGRRAQSDEEKGARRAQILATAARLFEEGDFASLTMARIAEEAGVAKGTLYLYFRTKEELFLQLLLERLAAWFGEMAPVLLALPAPMHPRDLAAVLARSAAARPDIVRLISLVHGVLEHNISVAQAREFKGQLLAWSMGFGAALERVFPLFAPGDGLHFCLYYYSIVVGLFQMSHPAPHVVEALDTPALRVMLIDFESHLAGILTGLLGGWWVGAPPHTPSTAFLQPIPPDPTKTA